MYDSITFAQYIGSLLFFSGLGIGIVEWFDKRFEKLIIKCENRFFHNSYKDTTLKSRNDKSTNIHRKKHIRQTR